MRVRENINGEDLIGGNIVEMIEKKIIDEGLGKKWIEIIDDRGEKIIEDKIIKRISIRINEVEIMEYLVDDKILKRKGEFFMDIWIESIEKMRKKIESKGEVWDDR